MSNTTLTLFSANTACALLVDEGGLSMWRTIIVMVAIYLAGWIGYVVGFDKGLSTGISANDSEMSWECNFSRVTEFAICDGRNKP